LSSTYRPSRAIISVAAQSDNLGDIIIRRAMAQWVREAGFDQVSVLVGSMPSTYVDACELDEAWQRYSSNWTLWAHTLRSALRERVIVIYAPGPYQIGHGWRGYIQALRNWAVAAFARRTGGGTAVVGRAYSIREGLAARLERKWISRSLFVTTRDFASAEALGTGAVCAPDLGFAHVVPPRARRSGDKGNVAVSLRSDVPANGPLATRIATAARAAGLNVVFYTQVARDNELHRSAARGSQAKADLWEAGTPHATRLEHLASEYASCDLMISDRLHACILAAAAGARVIGVGHSHPSKVSRTFEPLGGVTTVDGNVSVDILLRAIHEAQRDDVNEVVTSARRLLSVERDRFLRAVTQRSRGKP